MEKDQLTDDQLKVRETGLDRPNLPNPGALPPGGATWPVPHYLEFVGLINQYARTYRWTFDEALKNCRQNAVAMRNDVVLMEALRERQMMTAQLGWHLEPRDETDPAQVQATALLESIVRDTPNLQKMLMLLLEAVWYGRFGLQLTYEWDQYDPTRLKIKEYTPINGDSLEYRWSGGWGILVNGQFGGDCVPVDRGFAHFLTDTEKECVLIHTHEPFAADYYDPQLSGGVAGVGVRGYVYWWWFFKSNFLALLSSYAERVAYGIWIAYFDQNNPTGKADMEQAVANYAANRVITIPRTETGVTAYGLEIREPPSVPPGLLNGLIEYFDAGMRRYILGLALADGMNVGIGGDGADLLTSKVSRTVKYDSGNLAETLSAQLLPVLARWNTPGVPPPKFVFDTDKPNASLLLGFAEQIAQLGGAIDIDQLYEISGLSKPSPGDNVASKLQPQAAVGIPEGVPSAQPAGPEQQPQQVPATVQYNQNQPQ